MPNWGTILQEIINAPKTNTESNIDYVRRKYLKELYDKRGRNVICYYSGFLSKRAIYGIEINDEDKNGFMLCAHETERDRGLDLFLHTPGGDIDATISIVHYLRELYGNDICAIVPQIAMSAGTILACACKEIWMGKHSNLGPIDPHVNGLSVLAVKHQFKKVYNEVLQDIDKAEIWRPLLEQLDLAFLRECDWAEATTTESVTKYLRENMFKGKKNSRRRAQETVEFLSSEQNQGHNRHFHYQDCRKFGINIRMIEDDKELQDLILTVHHCFMHTLSNSSAY